MNHAAHYEQQFFKALKAIFIGARVEGESGYINLMRLKARYFEHSVFPRLRQEIEAACAPFSAAFREELFDKLHDFFSRYFSESGSLYFRHTAPHHSVYERIYSDDRDVMLFWKTQMLYYVKTDRLFHSLEVSVDGERFFFDVSQLEHKRANEKRELVYEFHRREKEGRLLFRVAYSERGRKTKTAEILAAVSQTGVTLAAETLAKACRVFEKQAEVDYFINKDARAFLQEQFDLWLYQYLFKGETQFNETRLKQLQTLKAIAYTLIDYIAHFEDELVRVWNKPKFVLDSHYIITLDKIAPTRPDLLADLFAHPGMAAQAVEWRDLGMIDDALAADPAGLLARLQIADLTGAPAYPAFHYLPLDTRHFPDREHDILALFDDPTTGSGQGLDAALDGWLIHSENYQALNTLLPKFRENVQAIYIDPPYNASATEIIYENRYKHSSWLTLINDRILLAREFLNSSGIICITIDDYELSRLQLALNEILGEDNYLATVLIRNNPSGRSTVKGFAINHEYELFYAKSSNNVTVGRFAHSEEQKSRYDQVTEDGRIFEWENLRKSSSGSQRTDRPKQFFPLYYNEETKSLRVPDLEWNESTKEYEILELPIAGEILLLPIDGSNRERVWSYGIERVMAEIEELMVIDRNGKKEVYKKKYLNEEGFLARTWWDNPAYSARDNGTRSLVELFGTSKLFEFPKALQAIEDSLTVCSVEENSIVLDFFAGSGTTAHAVMNLNRADGGRRKYILVEMGEHFHTVILPRVKKVAFSAQWKNGRPQDGQGMSHFVKYFALEQYEDTLRRAHYEDGSAPLFAHAVADMGRYLFLRDRKLLDAVTLDNEQNRVDVQLQKLYPHIDLAETLSCLTGKWIKRITPETVEFSDGASASLAQPDWELVKPLLWW